MEGVFGATLAYVLLVKKSTFHFLCPDSCCFAILSENLWDTCGSKVVDQNGEPLVVYHGARHAGFRVFDNEEGVRQSAAPDGTSFFSSSRDVAYSYAGRYEEPDLHDEEMQEEIEDYGIEQMDSGIYEVFLNIRDPHTIDFKGRNWQPDESFYSLVDENGDYIYPLNGEAYYNTEDEATERAEALGLKDYEVYSEYKDTNSVAQEGMDMGADGVIIENVIDEGSYGYGAVATDYIVFSPNQVKSATQNRGSFDTRNADITFSMPRNLAAVHSIPVDTMLDVEKQLGGLPKPSIAITRLDKPFSWGHAERVYLIGKPDLADPQQGNLVYDRDAWTGKSPFLLEGGSAYDYRKGEYFEPSLEAFVARTIKKKGQEDGSSFRGQSAVAIGTLDAVKAHREKLADTDTSNAQKAQTDAALDALIENVVKLSKKGLNEDEVATVMARVCWRSSPMNHGAPSEMKTSRDTAKRILNELGVRVKDIKKPLVDTFLKAVDGLKNELEDYLESVPQRAVMFNEFEYAVMPESMKDTPGLDDMLKRNGITPLWHNGTEEGRRAALAGLVNDSTVSFSVIGPKAKTWDKYKHRAFTGRDDGLPRAEIDASAAKLKAYSYSQDSTVVIPRFNAVIEFIRSNIRKHGRMQAVTDDWTGKYPGIDSYDEVLFVRRALEKIGLPFKNLTQLIESGVLEAVLSPTAANIGAFLKKVEWQPEGMSGYNKLEDVLEYPELFEAYPQLRQVPVLWQQEPQYRGLTSVSGTSGDVWVNMNEGLAPERMISTLLHEVQHAIQFIEGYAAGTYDFGALRGWMSDNGYLEQALTMENREIYARLAGEIESRNVQMRQNWPMDERLAKPFNSTLEYPGEAISVTAQNLGFPEVRFMDDAPVSFSMASVPLYHKILDTFEQRLSKDNKVVWVSRTSGNNMFTICPYPDVLNAITPWMRDVIAGKDVIKKLMNKHHLLPQDVAKLPQALWNPIAVFEDPKAKQGGFIVVSDILASNNEGVMKHVMVVLELKADNHNAVITDVKSAYSADKTDKYASLLSKGYLRYADKERALLWAGAEGDSILQLLTTALSHSDSGVMLKENKPGVNTIFTASMEKAHVSQRFFPRDASADKS